MGQFTRPIFQVTSKRSEPTPSSFLGGEVRTSRRSEVFVYEKCRFDTDVSGFSKTFRSVHQFDVDDQAETGGEMERWTTQVGHTGNRVDGGPICPKGDSGLTCLTCKRCGGWGPVEGCKGGIVGAR